MKKTKINYQSRILETSEQSIEFQKEAMKPHFVRWKLRYNTFTDDNGVEHTPNIMIDLLPYDWNQNYPNYYDGAFRVSSWHMPYDLWIAQQDKIMAFLASQLSKNLALCDANPSINPKSIKAI